MLLGYMSFEANIGEADLPGTVDFGADMEVEPVLYRFPSSHMCQVLRTAVFQYLRNSWFFYCTFQYDNLLEGYWSHKSMPIPIPLSDRLSVLETRA
eukprot:9457201-Ditylum_brightwellii.AAC.1